MEPKPTVELHAFRHPTDEQLRQLDHRQTTLCVRVYEEDL